MVLTGVHSYSDQACSTFQSPDPFAIYPIFIPSRLSVRQYTVGLIVWISMGSISISMGEPIPGGLYIEPFGFIDNGPPTAWSPHTFGEWDV